ncbi:MAG: dihydroxyacetone kinase subunit DhaK, partial [Alphaproteobacteria bacterium]|nr:dihydroxyacetone kinase subunit DhaK [Alphaproteobacteria bacterium]
MSQFINARETIVTDSIDGLLATSGGALTRLDGYPQIKVVVRANWGRHKVALVSGGGSGHEPSHAGMVGMGMLTAAVCGEVFTSPTVDAALAGILAVTGPAGCLLIVKNYTGDRLNFGLAAQRARALGLKVSMVVVDDDIALPKLHQPRGLAGTLFVHKIAGALAEQGADLTSVTKAAERVIRGVASIGMSLDTCTVPGSTKEDRIPAGKAELGLGIHGEPGVTQVDFTDAKQAVEMIIERLAPHMAKGPHAVLVNNLGGVTPLEMSILTNELLKTRIADQLSIIIGPASLMTSMDMQGFSVSVLPLSPGDTEALKVPVGPSAWPKAVATAAPRLAPMPKGLTPARAEPSVHPERRTSLLGCCETLIAAEADLNALDAKSGDGDTGSTLAGAARALAGAIDRLPLANLPELYRAIGIELSQTMGGSSGALLAIFFAAAGEGPEDDTPGTLTLGLERIKQVGGAAQGDRTMIDALAPALAALPLGVNEAAIAARAGADATASIIRAKAGRAAYVPEANLKGNNDPG